MPRLVILLFNLLRVPVRLAGTAAAAVGPSIERMLMRRDRNRDAERSLENLREE